MILIFTLGFCYYWFFLFISANEFVTHPLHAHTHTLSSKTWNHFILNFVFFFGSCSWRFWLSSPILLLSFLNISFSSKYIATTVSFFSEFEVSEQQKYRDYSLRTWRQERLKTFSSQMEDDKIFPLRTVTSTQDCRQSFVTTAFHRFHQKICVSRTSWTT